MNTGEARVDSAEPLHSLRLTLPSKSAVQYTVLAQQRASEGDSTAFVTLSDSDELLLELLMQHPYQSPRSATPSNLLATNSFAPTTFSSISGELNNITTTTETATDFSFTPWCPVGFLTAYIDEVKYNTLPNENISSRDSINGGVSNESHVLMLAQPMTSSMAKETPDLTNMDVENSLQISTFAVEQCTKGKYAALFSKSVPGKFATSGPIKQSATSPQQRQVEKGNNSGKLDDSETVVTPAKNARSTSIPGGWKSSSRFPCPHCPKSFNQNGNLVRHLVVHTKLRPYKCSTCKKGFSQKSHVRIHQSVHTGLKPYECPICMKCFSQLGHMNSHAKRHDEFSSQRKLKDPVGLVSNHQLPGYDII